MKIITLVMLALLLTFAGCANGQLDTYLADLSQARTDLAKVNAGAVKVDAAVATLPIDPKDRAKYDAERAKIQVWLDVADALLASQAGPTPQPAK